MRQKALGRKHSEDTKLLMSYKRGSSVNVYEKCDKEGFKLIGSFISARRAAKFFPPTTPIPIIAKAMMGIGVLWVVVLL